MLRNRSIAFFIDVDNVDLTSENFDSIVAQLEGMGQIYSGKVYGAKERKHKAIYDQAEVKGYKVERPMRIKRRGRRDFDSRIFVDVVDAVCRAPSIDAVCIVTASCDLVYLYSYLHGKGIKVISSDENEEASGALVDEYVDLGRVYDIDLPAVKPAPKKKRTATRPAVATATRSVARALAKNAEPTEASKPQQPAKDDKTDELLKEIERLKRVAEETQAEKEAKSKAAEEARAKAEAEAKARAEEREKARKEIEEAKAKAREEAEAKAREEERQRAQKEIEEARKRAQEAADKAKAEEEARAKAEAEIRLKLAELAKTGGNNDELMRELEKLKSLTSETNQLVKEMKDEPKEPQIVKVDNSAEEEARIREEERLKAIRVIEEAKAKARAEAEERVREQSESKAEAEKRAREEERLKEQQLRAEEREKARKEIEEAKAKAREEAEAKARAEEREKAQREIEEIRKKAQQAADKAKAEEEERQKAQAEIERLKTLAEQQAEEPDSPSAKYYMQRTDGKLLKKIEEINKGGSSDTDDELLATIQNLLDGLD